MYAAPRASSSRSCSLSVAGSVKKIESPERKQTIRPANSKACGSSLIKDAPIADDPLHMETNLEPNPHENYGLAEHHSPYQERAELKVLLSAQRFPQTFIGRSVVPR